MRLERLFEDNLKYYDEAIALYESAFPKEERRDADEQERIQKKTDYHFDFILEEEADAPVGLMLYWETEEFIFLEHFTTKNELRNQGYGSRALALLKEKGKKVILEIEPPVDELTMRRKGFYERNGFHFNEHFHIQPKYRHGDEDLELKIMSCPDVISREEYDAFYAYLMREVQIQ